MLELDLDTYHKYLGFMAGEASQAMRNGASDDDVIRLTAEFNSFKQRCLQSTLPDGVRSDISKVHVNYTSKAVSRSTSMIFIAVVTFGTAALLFYYMRRSERIGLLRELKTHLESLAMRTKLNY